MPTTGSLKRSVSLRGRASSSLTVGSPPRQFSTTVCGTGAVAGRRSGWKGTTGPRNSLVLSSSRCFPCRRTLRTPVRRQEALRRLGGLVAQVWASARNHASIDYQPIPPRTPYRHACALRHPPERHPPGTDAAPSSSPDPSRPQRRHHRTPRAKP